MTDQIKPADENLLRMDAYYYGFDATGVESVDIILSAIAHAGKAFHHTEDWNNECGERGDERIKGKSAVDWIQNAAEDAAFTVKDLIARIDALKAQVAAQEQSHRDILQSVGEEATRQIAELTKSVVPTSTSNTKARSMGMPAWPRPMTRSAGRGALPSTCRGGRPASRLK